MLFSCAPHVASEPAPPPPPPAAPSPDTRVADLAAQFASVLPPAPAGYSWGVSDVVPFAILNPDGWHWKAQFEQGTYGAFVTVESIEPPAMQYETGVSVNIILDVPTKTQMKPSVWAAAYVKELATKMTILEAVPTGSGPIQGTSVQAILHEVGQPDVRLANLILANDGTGTVYLVSAECPLDSWETCWLTLAPIMATLAISPDL